jgi:hypothetical protein
MEYGMVVTLKQIAQRRKITYRAVKKRRDREGWLHAGKKLINHKEAEIFNVDSLPSDLKELFVADFQPELDLEAEIYSSAPEWARGKADKYIAVLRASKGLKGTALKRFISGWNIKHPDLKTSYPRVVEARRIYWDQGVSGLLAHYGRAAGRSIVKDEWFKYFKAAYLVEGAPSVKSCWIKTLGYVKGLARELVLKTFPSPKSFLRRLEREIPKSAIYLARYGKEAWNRKYGTYIDRDYTNLNPGECLVSDHAQVDVAVMIPSGKICFPWVTAWRDFKSGMWLSWLHHPETPNSDHVFQSFYYAVRKYGLPADVYMDNGKDYRCRDFAGGKKYHKVAVDEGRAMTMLSMLEIIPHFSLPRNAQAKTIERDFLKNKEWFSKHVPGYRGGHVRERPEKLKDEIKAGKVLGWGEFTELMDVFIKDVLNKMPSGGKVLQGMSPEELWDRERTKMRKVSIDALRLFCMRTSRALTIGRNGVRDSEVGCTYWAEWMTGIKGEKVYLRRDIAAYQEAWVFNAKDDEYLGKAYMAESAAALARTPVEKAQLKRLLAQKKRIEKITKSFIEIKDVPSPDEALAHMRSGVAVLNKHRGYKAGKSKCVGMVRLPNTAMDQAIRKEKEMQKEGTYDLSAIVPPERDKRKIHIFETDRVFEEGRD